MQQSPRSLKYANTPHLLSVHSHEGKIQGCLNTIEKLRIWLYKYIRYKDLGTCFNRLQEKKQVITAIPDNLNPGAEIWIM